MKAKLYLDFDFGFNKKPVEKPHLVVWYPNLKGGMAAEAFRSWNAAYAFAKRMHKHRGKVMIDNLKTGERRVSK